MTKKKITLLLMSAVCVVCTLSAKSVLKLGDFENGIDNCFLGDASRPWGTNFGASVKEVVDNPSPDIVHGNSKVLKVVHPAASAGSYYVLFSNAIGSNTVTPASPLIPIGTGAGQYRYLHLKLLKNVTSKVEWQFRNSGGNGQGYCSLEVAGSSQWQNIVMDLMTSHPSNCNIPDIIASVAYTGFYGYMISIDKTYVNTGGFTVYIDDIYLSSSATPIQNLVIEADDTKTISQSNYIAGSYYDVIIKSDDTSTGRLNISGGADIDVNGVVKFQKTFTAEKWYAVGFPFNVASVACDNDGSLFANSDGYDQDHLKTYDETGGTHSGTTGDYGDYFLRTCNATGTGFDDYPYGSRTIAKGGYILQIGDQFDGATFTFISEPNVSLSNDPTMEVVANNTYQLVYNPLVADLSIEDETPADYYYYAFNQATNNFARLDGSYPLKPFESVVAANTATPTALRTSLNVENLTSLPNTKVSDGKVISTEYYNLQGVRIAQPQTGSIYIVKSIYESGKTSVAKKM